MGVLIEHYAGAFPFWLAPVQIWIIPISDNHKEYANKIGSRVRSLGFRVQVKDDNETLGKKIRKGEMQKIPYLLIVGDKEIKTDSVGVRQRSKGDIGIIKTEEFIKLCQKSLNQLKN